MRSLLAFLKKEITEQMRSGRLVLLLILFVLFGIMNPAVAKITPWLLEALGDSLAQNGMIITEVEVSALDSWVQFFKNIPMALIAFVLLQSSIFTREYSSGTLVLSLTKGLERYKVVVSKAVVLTLLWTVGYWICFAITYGYNAYFWDNSIAEDLAFSGICWWMFGVWVISIVVLFSTIAKANIGVLVLSGGVVLLSYLVGMIPKIGRYFPTYLTDGNSLIYGVADAEKYTWAIVITSVITMGCFVASVPIFNKKQL